MTSWQYFVRRHASFLYFKAGAQHQSFHNGGKQSTKHAFRELYSCESCTEIHTNKMLFLCAWSILGQDEAERDGLIAVFFLFTAN